MASFPIPSSGTRQSTAAEPARHRYHQGNEFTLDLPERADPDQVSRRLLRELADQLEVTTAELVFRSEATGEVFVASRLARGVVLSLDRDAAQAILNSPLVAQVLQDGKGIVIADLARDRRRHLVPDYRTGSLLIWPIRRKNTTIGVLTAHTSLPYAFTEQDLQRVETLLFMTGTALHEALRVRQEHLYRDQSLALLTMSQTLAGETSISDLAAAVHHAGLVFQATYSLLFLADGERTVPVRLPALLSQPSGTEALQRITILATQTWRSRTALTARSQIERTTLHSVAVPLVHSGQCYGAIVLVGNDPSAFRYAHDTWSLLTIMTQMLAGACASLLQRTGGQLPEEEVAALVMTHIKVQRSRDLVRTVFDTLPDGMLLLDDNLTILAANQTFCRDVVNHHPREVVGQRYEGFWQDIVARGEVYLAPNALHVRLNDPDGYHWYTVERCEVPGRHGEAPQHVEIWRESSAQEFKRECS